jgi:hypothetical protein
VYLQLSLHFSKVYCFHDQVHPEIALASRYDLSRPATYPFTRKTPGLSSGDRRRVPFLGMGGEINHIRLT